MPCPKCNGRLAWKDRSWTHAGEVPGHWGCIMCGKLVYPVEAGLPNDPQNIPDNGGIMSNRLKSEKEEEVKGLLKTLSIREIVAITGVAKNTIARIRDENFTEAERATLKKSANVKGRNKRELEEREPRTDLQNDGPIIPLTNSDRKGGQEIMTQETQVCSNDKCPKQNPQLIGEFNKNAARPSGRESRCRTCTAQAQRDRKIAIEKQKKQGGPGRRHRLSTIQKPGPYRLPSSNPPPNPFSGAVTLDAQLLKAVKRSAILDFVKNDLPRMIEEAFA